MSWCFDRDHYRGELTSADEQLKMNDCYYDKKDWRACRKEVSAALLNPNQRAKMPRVLESSPCFGQSTDAWCRWSFSGNAGSGMETTRGLRAKTPSSCISAPPPPSQVLDVFNSTLGVMAVTGSGVAAREAGLQFIRLRAQRDFAHSTINLITLSVSFESSNFLFF